MKMQVPFMQLPLAFDATALQAEVCAIETGAWRPHPQGFPGNDALPLIAANGDPGNDSAAGPMRPTPHLERSPYLRQVLAAIGATWGRTRLMRLSGQAEVSRHVDVNYYWRERVRVHVPIVTQPTVRFCCGDAQTNMRAGECWIFDTWRPHHVVNDHSAARVHLVADTVGGSVFWQHVNQARPHDRQLPGWSPRLVQPNSGAVPELDFESENVPAVMTPWEVRSHIAFLLSEAVQDVRLPKVHDALVVFTRDWHALWSCYGVDRSGWPRYRAVLDAARPSLLAAGAGEVGLRNGLRLMAALEACVLEPALADRRNDTDPETREAPSPRAAAAPAAAPGVAATDPVFDRPVFIVCPPRSGSTLLFETLAQAPGVFTIGDESHQLIEGITALRPDVRDFDSNRLLGDDATPAIAQQLRSRFVNALRDRAQCAPPPGERIRMLEKTPKNALRVPFLASVFPEARFIYLYRDAREVLSSMMEAWSSGGFRTYPGLPGWTGLPWSLLLTPGWRALIGAPLNRIVAEQWQTTTRLLLDDLEQLPRERWAVAHYDALVSDPESEVRRLCAAMALEWDRPLDAALPLSRYTVSPPAADKWQRRAADIDPVLPSIMEQVERVRRLAAVSG
jgi:Sulfotransferase family/Aspartyl/Asparaginyl beta-hydroxylase